MYFYETFSPKAVLGLPTEDCLFIHLIHTADHYLVKAGRARKDKRQGRVQTNKALRRWVIFHSSTNRTHTQKRTFECVTKHGEKAFFLWCLEYLVDNRDKNETGLLTVHLLIRLRMPNKNNGVLGFIFARLISWRARHWQYRKTSLQQTLKRLTWEPCMPVVAENSKTTQESGYMTLLWISIKVCSNMSMGKCSGWLREAIHDSFSNCRLHSLPSQHLLCKQDL